MDKRTKRQKLQAMANQSVSPNEAEVAKAKLAEMGSDIEPVPIQADIHFYQYTTSGNVDFSSFWFGNFNFAEPFRETKGEGFFVYDFVKQEWRKVG